ncbi:diguanylate cyclase domain-containing protein [sulfur-oxidizing endosymbiont of Gigantopelta aegis]|uniref:diguanylate cyclase domain-containing protein n=1 Tax=sulfur-oxidizing endosymbiont of Gigantopelta aegis TaxID=2794934 RepID=UPI0018DE3C98|nr:diguanylate cyclase [sulfur-oxidizing endosymbiont of Gigantopelta aegis]
MSNKILIVDDTAENITLLTEILQLKAYQISAAKEGERAIKIACHIQPDLILLDIMMPGIDGFETCRRLKNNPLTKDIPVIFISAKTDVDDLVMGFSVGGKDYINKPFHEQEIYARVANQLQIQALNNQLACSEKDLRKLLEEHQQQSKQLQQIVALVIDGILELDCYGNIQTANPAIAKLFGVNAQAIHSLNITQFFAEPFKTQYNILFEHHANRPEQVFTQQTSIEIIARQTSGREFPIEFSLMKIPANENRYLAVIHDITAHKNKEEKLRHLSYIDSLTNLSNRRRFDEEYEKAWLQGQRNKSRIAFIMIDIDFFKQFNDTYGHQEGDVCLQKIAQALKNEIKRPGDIVARIGGEEFAVILPETSREGVTQVADQLRSIIQALKIPHKTSKHHIVTVSLGVAITTIGEECYSSSMLYQMADKALYQAKQNGRNQYSFF